MERYAQENHKNFKGNALKLLCEQMVAVRDYMRLATMQEAHEKLDDTKV